MHQEKMAIHAKEWGDCHSFGPVRQGKSNGSISSGRSGTLRFNMTLSMPRFPGPVCDFSCRFVVSIRKEKR